MSSHHRHALSFIITCGLAVGWISPDKAIAEPLLRKLGQLRLEILGIQATIDPAEPVVPKGIASGVRIVVSRGGVPLTADEVEEYIGAGYEVHAELSGPGLPATITLPYLRPGEAPSSDPLLLPIPALPVAGDYELSNVRIVAESRPSLDVHPESATVRVIDQILVTSVKTRPLTLDEIKEKGIVLDSDDYLGFEFTMAFMLESKVVDISFPVLFNTVTNVPAPELIPDNLSLELPVNMPFAVYPTLLTVDGDNDSGGGGMPSSAGLGDIRIPSVLVIPGNVGYLKQFFSAQLFVANGAPLGSGLLLKDIEGEIEMPPGKDLTPGTDDDPLALPEISRDGQTIRQPVIMSVVNPGSDEKVGTGDDDPVLRPAEQGQAEFLLRADKIEGYHKLRFDVRATLEGLPVGDVKLKGEAHGGVLVRNAHFNMTFSVPSVVRVDEPFSLYAIITNTGEGNANDLTVQIDGDSVSGALLVGDAEQVIDTLEKGDTETLEFRFVSQKTGQVTASYLRMEGDDPYLQGNLRFRVGVGERGVPLSPDTLVLPSAVSELPSDVVRRAMRVLGQAYSVANAPGGLPSGVRRVRRATVKDKALLLAEAGLRIQLGQPLDEAVRDLWVDYYGTSPADLGFDQILRETTAGRDFARSVGATLSDKASDLDGFVRDLSSLAASNMDLVAFAVGEPVGVAVSDSASRVTSYERTDPDLLASAVPGSVILPLGDPETAPLIGLVALAQDTLYRIQTHGAASLDLCFTALDGELYCANASLTGAATLVVDRTRPEDVTIEENGDEVSTSKVGRQGPRLVAVTVIGPEVLSQANPFGMSAVALFDRAVDEADAAIEDHYSIPKNSVLAASRRLSGRLVFLTLQQPEGPYVPTTLAVDSISDPRGTRGSAGEIELVSKLRIPGGVARGRVLNADGSPAPIDKVYYRNQTEQGDSVPTVASVTRTRYPYIAAIPVDSNGAYEIRYVRQEQRGRAFSAAVYEPTHNAERLVAGYVRSVGEIVILDVVIYGRGAVEGVVTAAGKVVPGAQVVAMSDTDPGTGGRATTDAQGYYAIEDLTVGGVSVKALAETSVGPRIGTAWGRIERAGSAARIDVDVADDSINVSGCVSLWRDSQLVPVPGAVVLYQRAPSYRTIDYAVAASESTAEMQEGCYRFENMPPGEFMVAINGYHEYSGRTALRSGAGDEKNVDFVLSIAHTGIAGGLVRLPSGEAASGVFVGAQGSARGVMTKEDGSFILPGVPINRPVTIAATTTDRLRQGSTSVLIGASGVVDNVVIVLSGLGAAEFLVLDPAGQPVANQAVRLHDGMCTKSCGCAEEITDVNGRARFEGLPIGEAVAVARRFVNVVDVASGKAAIKADGETAQGILRFGGGGSVHGRVLPPSSDPDEGAVIVATGGKVSLISKHYPANECAPSYSVSHSGYVDINTNEFHFDGVNVGPVNVKVENPFFPPAYAQGVITRDGETVTLEVQLVDDMAKELSGMVHLPDGETPVGAGIQVSVEGRLPEVQVRTDETGEYHFPEVLPAGRYQLTALDPETGNTSRTTIDLKERESARHDLRLMGRGNVNVHVIDGSGNPAPNAFLILQETDYPRRTFETVIEPAEGGMATIRGVFEGRFSVTAEDTFGRGGRVYGEIPEPESEVDVTLTLDATGTVRGRFLRPTSEGAHEPVPYSVVTLKAGGRAIGTMTTPGSGDDAGRFLFEYVPKGSLTIEARDPLTLRSGIATDLSITQDGQVVEIDVYAKGLGAVHGIVTHKYGDGDTRPVPGANVQIVSGDVKITTTTSAEESRRGEYSVVGVPEGRVVATAYVGEEAQSALAGKAEGDLVGEGGLLQLDVALRDSGPIEGVVIPAIDGDLEICDITIQSRSWPRYSYTTTTGPSEDGRFEFSNVPSGPARIKAAVRHSVDLVETDIDMPASGTVELRLNGVAALSGRALLSASEQPAPGRLHVSGKGRYPYSYDLTIGAGGHYELPQILAGPFVASLQHIGNFVLNGTADTSKGDCEEPAPGESVQCDVRLEPTANLVGRIVRNGNDGIIGVPGASVVVRLGQSRGAATFITDGDGRFSVTGTPMGSHTLHAASLSGGLAYAAIVLNEQEHDGLTVDLGVIALIESPLSVEQVLVDSRIVAPDGNIVDVPVEASIEVRFSVPMKTSWGLRVMSGATQVSAHSVLSQDARTMTLKPYSGKWPDSMTLTLLVTREVTDVFDRRPLEEQSYFFTTVDLSPPKVVSISPANNQIQIAVGEPIRVTFDEPIGAVSGGATPAVDVVVKMYGGATLTGTPSFADSENRTVVFQPDVALASDSTYYVTVNGAEDVFGWKQTAAFYSQFKTIDTVNPQLSLHSPSDDSWTNNARPQIWVLLSDATSGIESNTARMSLDGASVPATASASWLSYTPDADLSQSWHIVAATAQDRAGHEAAFEGRFGVDVEPPEPPSIEGLEDGAIVRDDVVFTARVSDAMSGVQKVELLDGQRLLRTVTIADPSSCTSDCTVNVTLQKGHLSEGEHTLGVRASDQAKNESATTSVTVTVDYRIGTVTGAVFGPDGVTRHNGATVKMAGASAVSGGGGVDGEFTIEDVPEGTLDLEAYVNDRRRARETVTISAETPSVTQDLVLIGVGTVSGIVTKNGVPVSDANVSLASKAGIFGGTLRTTTSDGTSGDDPKGFYAITDVPVGEFTVSVTSGPDRGSGGGAIDDDGQNFVLDIALMPNTVNLPITLGDGNGLSWQVHPDGGLSHGYMFGSHYNEPNPFLALVRVDDPVTEHVFAGDNSSQAASEELKREIVLEQEDLAGLRVTREIFVPTQGYFVRYLERLHNPTDEPIRLHALVRHDLGKTCSVPEVVTTSSGDDVFTTDDDWITLDDATNQSCPEDIYSTSYPEWQFPPLAILTSSVTGSRPSDVSLTSGDSTTILTHRWDDLEIPAHATVALMHVFSAQADRARAKSAAERLVQLPPELLEGLERDEANSIVNFQVPEGLQSGLDPLPANDGAITGVVLAGDEMTPVYASIKYRNRSPYYGWLGAYNTSPYLDGAFNINSSNSKSMPRAAFDLTITPGNYNTYISFDDAALEYSAVIPDVGNAEPKIVFAGKGVVTGIVRRSDAGQTPITSTQVALTCGSESETTLSSYGANAGIYLYWLVPPGDCALSATYNTVTVTEQVTIPADPAELADLRIERDLVFPEFGALSVTTYKATSPPSPTGAYLTISGPNGFSASPQSGSGEFYIEDIPPGEYTISALDMRGNKAQVSTTASVVTGQSTTVALTFPPTADVKVTVLMQNSGVPVSNVYVYWEAETVSGLQGGGYTDENGQVTIKNVPGGFTVRVTHPNNNKVDAVQSGAVQQEGVLVDVTVELPEVVASVPGTLATRDGVGLYGAVKALHAIDDALVYTTAYTSSAGEFSLSNVPAGAVRLRASANEYYSRTPTGQLYYQAEVDATIEPDVPVTALMSHGSISTSGRPDLWQVNAAEDDSFTITLYGPGTADPLNPLIAVFGTDGKRIAENDDISATNKDSRVQFTAPVSGSYLIAVDGSGGTTGSYRMGLGASNDPHFFRVYAGPLVAGVVRRETEEGPPVAELTVRLTRDDLDLPTHTTVTDENGRYELPLVPGEGEYLVEVVGGSDVVIGSASGEGANDAFNIVIPATSLEGTITGVVRNGDDQAPLPGATVALDGALSVTTGAEGEYEFTNVAPGEHALNASFETPAGTVSLDQTIAISGGTEIADFTLPVAVLRGKINDPTAPSTTTIADVRACYYSVCDTRRSAPNGDYVFYGLPAWSTSVSVSVTATVTDGSSLRAYSSFKYRPATTHSLDLTLPETGAVSGSILDADGNGVSNAVMTLYEDYRERTCVVEDGTYFCAHVRPGPVRVFAVRDLIPGENGGTVTAGANLPLDVQLAATGSLDIGLDRDGSLIGGPVRVQALDAPRRDPTNPWTAELSLTDAIGGPRRVTVTVPIGAYRVVYDDLESPPAANEGVLAKDESRQVTLDSGSHVRLPRTLEGEAARYSAGAGYCEDEGASTPCGSFVESNRQQYETESYPNLARPEFHERALRSLLVADQGVRMRRQHYVPESGAFARTLTTIHNSGTEPVTVRLESRLVSASEEIQVESTSSGDLIFDESDAYVVVSGVLTLESVVLGELLPGDPGSFWINERYSEGGPPGVLFANKLTLDPGQTMAFLTFSVIGSDEAQVLETTQKLADLSHPDALIGLTAAELQAIVNFETPQTGLVSGQVTDNGVPVAGIRVGLMSATGTLVAQAETTAETTAVNYQFDEIAEGSYTLVAFHPIENRPAQKPIEIVGGTAADGNLSLPPVEETAGITVQGWIEGTSDPAAGATVLLAMPGFAPFWRPSLTLNGNGQGAFLGVPLGEAILEWDSPSNGEPEPIVVPPSMSPVVLYFRPNMSLPTSLSGTNGLTYDVDASGAAGGPGMSCTPFCGTWSGVNGFWFPYDNTQGVSRQAGREIVVGPYDFGELRASRRVFVPASGDFVRLIDVIENTTSADTTATLGLDGSMSSATGEAWTVEDASGDGFVDESDSLVVLSAPSTFPTAFVLRGETATIRPDFFDWFGDGSISSFQTWSFPVPANMTRLFMQFVVEQPVGGLDSARQIAEQLAAATHPDAFLGLTAEERSTIVNFGSTQP
ncbi:MAG: carboxypeptidase regulatory-like domain-containing protein [Vicinamibacteria bacterium]|nr:carboxypeptidase regulatory-like domain-containing protein [Vicinamibacteria bacterium]